MAGVWGKWFKILHSNNFLGPTCNYNSKKHFLESEFFKNPSSHCYQSKLVTATFIGQMFYGISANQKSVFTSSS